MSNDIEDFATAVEEAAEDVGVDLDDEQVETIADAASVQAEIAELQGFLDLARSIGTNAKGDNLVSQLPTVLDQIVRKGGRRKAVIFTESVRTQTYLHQLLSAHGYAGQIVLLNGSNGDPESRSIYEDWKAKHAGSDRLSGSRSADMKAAIVDAFKADDRTILIATESGAEGINLQFCSLVINFDLPWNPQRVEQRIGRCHRYGQLIDVTVVNMLNLGNKTERRIHELLTEKFHLFEGVFGASDEVLGSLMGGVDFEREVLNIVQNCRTEEEAEREFDALKARIQDTIDADMLSARAKALETLDAEVVAKLHDREKQLSRTVPVFMQRLLMVARAELAGMVPDPVDHLTFQHDGKVYTTEWPKADDRNWQFFRVTEGLGKEIVDSAKARDHRGAPAALVFHPEHYPFDGQLSAVKNLGGKSGWLRAVKARMETKQTLREDIILACVDDDGRPVDGEVADKLLMAPASENGVTPARPGSAIDALDAKLRDAFGARVKQENADWIDEEEKRLDRYAADIEIELDAQIDALDAEIKELQKRRRSPDIALEDKLAVSRTIKRLEGDIDELKSSKFERRRQVRKEAVERLDELADSLNRQPVFTELFTLRWQVA